MSALRHTILLLKVLILNDAVYINALTPLISPDFGKC